MLTNLCKLVFVAALLFAPVGCGGENVDPPANTGPDLSTSVGGGGGSHDMAQSSSGGGADMAKMSSSDGGSSGGLKPLCQTCTQDNECASGSCVAYMGGAIKKCSHTCATATAATDCPGINACNGMNVCKCM
jgi:hypothetical protein